MPGIGKILFSVVVCVVVASNVVSAESLACNPKKLLPKGDAEKLLAQTQETYRGVKGFSATFSQLSFLAALETSERSGGTVWFQSPGMMKWYYRTPDEQVLLLKEKTMWFYQANEKQVLIDSFEQAFESDMPVSFLLGIGDLGKQFQIVSACRTSGTVTFELTPRSGASQQVKLFRLRVEGKSLFPQAAEIEDSGGNSNAIELSEIKREDSFDGAVFAADFPSGIDVQDRRSKL